MAQEERSRKIYECMYLAAFALYAFTSVINASLIDFSTVANYARDITLGVMLLITILRLNEQRRSLIELFLIVAVLAIFYKVGNTVGRPSLYVFAAMIASAEVTELRKTAKVSMAAVLAGLGVIWTGILFGRVTDYLFPHGDKMAHCLGFSYYSAAPFYLFYCILMYLYVRKTTLKWIEIAVLAVINQLIYHVCTLGLTWMLGLLVLILYVLIVKLSWIRIDGILPRILAVVGYPLGFVLSCISMLYYDETNSIWIRLNALSHNRIKMNYAAWQMYPITKFGQVINMRGNSALHETVDYFYIDSAFVYDLLGYGILLTILVIGMYTYLYLYTSRKNEKVLYIWITAVLLFSMMNNTWLNLHYNPLLTLVLPALGSEFPGRKGKTE